VKRSDVMALFLVSFLAGALIATGIVQVVDLDPDLWPGVGAASSAAVAAFLFKRQQDRRY
jgi:hypothetical protein